jgi:non-canonical (house-cleaning) NTP pyrophosphatase
VEELQRLARDGALDALYLTDTVETTVRRLVQSAESPRFFFRVASIAPIVHADLFRTARPHVAFENTPPATAQVQTDQAQTFQAKVQAQGGAEADGDAKAQAQAQPQTQAQVHAQDGGEAQAQAQAQVQAHVQAEVQAKAAGQGEAADQVQVQDQVQDQVQEQVQEQGASVLNQQSEIRVCVCSESEIKVQAVGDALRRMGWSGVQVVPLADCASGVRAQPQTYQETVRGCTTRLATGMRMCKPEGPCDLCVAIENGIDERSGNDFAFVVVTDSEGDSASASSTSVPVPPAAVAASGTHQTYADILFETGPYTKDPHQALCGVSRAEILALTVRVAVGRLPRWRRPI